MLQRDAFIEEVTKSLEKDKRYLLATNAERKEGVQVAGIMVVFVIVASLLIHFDWTPGLHHLF